MTESPDVSKDFDLEVIKSEVIEKVLQEKSLVIELEQLIKCTQKDDFIDSNEILKQYTINNIVNLEKIALEESDSEDDLPLAARLNQEPWRNQHEVKMPQINKNKLEKYLEEIQENEKFVKARRKMTKCNCHDCVSAQVKSRHWNSPNVILKAIRHAIFTQKWSNVTKLLLMLIPHGIKYQSYIAEMCEKIEEMDPRVEQNPELQKQFGILKQLYGSKKSTFAGEFVLVPEPL